MAIFVATFSEETKIYKMRMTKHLAETDSTSNQLRTWLNNEEVPDYSIVYADFQSTGRGQIGNSWESERGKNLLMSMVVRPKGLDIHEQFYLSMAVSNAITDIVAKHIPNVEIKWPNDIYVDNQKLAGILIENTLRGSQIADTIVGLGLNVNQTVFTSNAPNPVSMKTICNRELDVNEIMLEIQKTIEQWMQKVDSKQFGEIRTAYAERLFRNDGELHAFADKDGQFEASISSIRPEGHLVLTDSQGVDRQYAFKEVEFIL